MNKITLTIDGMMCGMCEAHVNDAVHKVVGDRAKVSSSHATGKTEILVDQTPDIARLKHEIKSNGYQVTDIAVEAVEEKKRGLFSLFRK